jgi:thiol-disulfide isomerase/thioredoxin
MRRHGVRRKLHPANLHAVMAGLAALLTALVVQAAATIYPDVGRGDADIAAGLKEAAKTNRRVLVDFGGNWCPDCIVLDHHLQATENASLLKKHYVLVHVNVGVKGITDNFVIAERYGIPLKKGVPALAVLEPDGRVVFAQKQGEFEAMRKLDPASVRDFLKKWAKYL